MSGNPPGPVHIALPGVPGAARVEGGCGNAAGSAGVSGEAKVGGGALQGRRISIGTSGAAPVLGAFAKLPLAVRLAVQGVPPATALRPAAQPQASADMGRPPAEHACSALLKITVHEPFMLVVRTAQGLGLATGMDLEVHEKQLQFEELPYAQATLARLKKEIRALPTHSAAHLSLLDLLVQTQAALAVALGPQASLPDYLSIERRGVQLPADPALPHA